MTYLRFAPVKNRLTILVFCSLLYSCGDSNPLKRSEKKVYIEVEKNPPPGKFIIAVENPESLPTCSEENLDEIVYVSSDRQTYRCDDQKWISYEEQKLIDARAKLIGDWHAKCHPYSDGSGAIEYKISFFEDGSITSGAIRYDSSDCLSVTKLTDPRRSGWFELAGLSTINLSNAMFISKEFYSRIYFEGEYLHIAQPFVSGETSELEPFYRNFIKLERANFPTTEQGFKIYF